MNVFLLGTILVVAFFIYIIFRKKDGIDHISINNPFNIIEKNKNEAFQRLTHAFNMPNDNEKIQFLDDCINWFLDIEPHYDNKSLRSEPYLFEGIKLSRTNIPPEYILALYFFTRGRCNLTMFENDPKVFPHFHMDFNFASYFSYTDEMIGMISCLRKSSPLLMSDVALNTEYTFSKKCLGVDNEDFVKTWEGYFGNENNELLPMYYYVFKIDNAPSYLTLHIPVKDNDNTFSKWGHPILHGISFLRERNMNNEANSLKAFVSNDLFYSRFIEW